MSQKTFSYIESPAHPDQTCIGINTGKFAGVVYKYGSITPIEENGGLTMQFEFDILENNSIPRDEFDDEFFKLIGDILMEILDEKLNDYDTGQSDTQ